MAISNPTTPPSPELTGDQGQLGTQDNSGQTSSSGSASQPLSTTAGLGTPSGVGMIDSNQFTSQKAAQGTSTGYGATNVNVTPNMTVQGQVKGIIDQNSPLMQQAVTSANQAAASKGLLNSSMATTAGQSALYGAAMPMAQQDAQTYANAATANAAATNTASQFTADQKNAMTAQNVSQQNDFTKSTNANSLQAQMSNQSVGVQQASQAYDAAVKGAMQSSDHEQAIQLANLDSNVRTSLMNLQAKYNIQSQASSSEGGAYQALVGNITSIMNDQTLDAAAKQSAINNLYSMFQNQMDMQGAITGLNLGQMMNPGGSNPVTPPGGNTAVNGGGKDYTPPQPPFGTGE